MRTVGMASTVRLAVVVGPPLHVLPPKALCWASVYIETLSTYVPSPWKYSCAPVGSIVPGAPATVSQYGAYGLNELLHSFGTGPPGSDARSTCTAWRLYSPAVACSATPMSYGPSDESVALSGCHGVTPTVALLGSTSRTNTCGAVTASAAAVPASAPIATAIATAIAPNPR